MLLHNFKEEAEVLSALFELFQLTLNVSSLTHRLWSLSLPTEEGGCVCPFLEGLELPFCPVLLWSRNAFRLDHFSKETAFLPDSGGGRMLLVSRCWHTLPAHVQLVIHQPPQVLLSRAAVCLFMPQPELNQGLSWTSENKWGGNLVKKTVNLSTLLWEVFLNVSFYVVICWWKSEISISLSWLYLVSLLRRHVLKFEHKCLFIWKIY